MTLQPGKMASRISGAASALIDNFNFLMTLPGPEIVNLTPLRNRLLPGMALATRYWGLTYDVSVLFTVEWRFSVRVTLSPDS